MRRAWGNKPLDFDPSKDYYKILGIPKTSKISDIKKKYYQLARESHPDQNPNADQDKFKRVTNAYTILSKEETRKQYDQMRDMRNQGTPFGGQGSPFGNQAPGGQ